MNLWGYKISEARGIDYDKSDKSLPNFLAERSPSSKLCIGCGGCTATCTAGQLTEFNIRQVQMLLKRGVYNGESDRSLHKCMLCGKCLLVCPRGVDTRKMILTIIEYSRANEHVLR